MSSSDDGSGLSALLDEIKRIDEESAALDSRVEELKKRRDHLEHLAVEAMLASKLDGVRVAGRTWRIEWAHSMSVTTDRRGEVVDAARAEGWEGDVVTINTAKLKALLTERAKDAGTDARVSYTQGTKFDGLVGEYVRPVLRHLTVRA